MLPKSGLVEANYIGEQVCDLRGDVPASVEVLLQELFGEGAYIHALFLAPFQDPNSTPPRRLMISRNR